MIEQSDCAIRNDDKTYLIDDKIFFFSIALLLIVDFSVV